MNNQWIWIITHLLQTIKCFYYTADVAVEEKSEYLIISSIEGNEEA